MRVFNRNAMFYPLIAIAYVISGKAALMLALPPGYASAIFPPAGIAVAAAFIAGRRTLPWVFLGSLLLNIWVGYSASNQINALGLVVAFVIAAASMLQAGIGGWVLRRAVGYPASFDHVRDIFRFLFLAPVICLTSASLSVTSLWILGIFDTNSLGANWLSWWVGDSLGVIVLLPIMMVIAGEPRRLWRSRTRTVAIPMILIFALFVVMFLKTNQWERDDSLNAFRQVSQQSLNQIQTRLEEQATVLSGMYGLFVHDANGHVTRQEFQRYSQNILKSFPMIQALEWAPLVDSSQRASFEAARRKDNPGFEIRESNAAGKQHRASDRSQYFPVAYVEPLIGNELAMGFDLNSTPKRHETLIKAAATGLPIATAPIRLVQADNQIGMLIMQSVQLDSHESGILLTVLKVRDFVDKTLPHGSTEFHLRLIDDDEHSMLYDNFASGSSAVLFERTFDFGTRHYRFQTTPTAAYVLQHRGWQSWGVLAMGTLGTGLLGSLLLLGTGYTARVVTQVDERTRELKESESRFRTMADSAPVFIWMSDKNNVATWFNQTMLDFRGRSLEQESAGGWIEGIYPGDLPCLEKFARYAERHEPFQMEFRLKRHDGEYRWILDSGIPRFDTDGNFVGYIGSGVDITERKQAVELLRHMAHYDTLTELPNRAMFTDRMHQALATAKRDNTHLAVMFIDLDNFKPINDELGHQVGDLLLKEAARRMQDCVRESDTVARIGGDEFVVLLPAMEKEQDALLVAEKIRHALNQPFMLAGQNLNISSSAGIAVYPEHGGDDKQLMKNADVAMYHAKKSGRNRVKLFQADMHNVSDTKEWVD